MGAQLRRLVDHERAADARQHLGDGAHRPVAAVRGVLLENGRSANAAARRLADAAPSRLVHPVEANELFLRMSADEAASLRSQGFDFYDWGPGEIRLVTSWDSDEEHVARLAAAIGRL